MNEQKISQEKESCIGSVRFYKHFILTCITMAVIIPVYISVLPGFQVHFLHTSNTFLQNENEQLQSALKNILSH